MTLIASRLDVPPGLADSWPPCVWARQHSSGPWLCVHRIGTSAAVVWRTYAFFKSWAYCIAEYDGDGTDAAIESAKAHVLLLLEDSDAAPEALLPKNREAERRARQSNGVVRAHGGRPRTTPEEKARKAAERQAAYRARKAERASNTDTRTPQQIEEDRQFGIAYKARVIATARANGAVKESELRKAESGGVSLDLARWLMSPTGKLAMQATKGNA